MITALSDNRFSAGGDSGSIYYAVRGSFRYPIAVNNGEGYDLIKLCNDELFDNNKTAKPIFFGTPLVRSIKKYWSLDESSWPNRRYAKRFFFQNRTHELKFGLKKSDLNPNLGLSPNQKFRLKI